MPKKQSLFVRCSKGWFLVFIVKIKYTSCVGPTFFFFAKSKISVLIVYRGVTNLGLNPKKMLKQMITGGTNLRSPVCLTLF